MLMPEKVCRDEMLSFRTFYVSFLLLLLQSKGSLFINHTHYTPIAINLFTRENEECKKQ